MIGLTEYCSEKSAPSRCFEIGDVVTHKIQGYRGVIVDFDEVCKARDKWYNSHNVQPSRNQPWYSVLVHNSGGLSTYAAQSNLEKDHSGRAIEHPRIGHYFRSFDKGRYLPKGVSGP